MCACLFICEMKKLRYDLHQIKLELKRNGLRSCNKKKNVKIFSMLIIHRIFLFLLLTFSHYIYCIQIWTIQSTKTCWAINENSVLHSCDSVACRKGCAGWIINIKTFIFFLFLRQSFHTFICIFVSLTKSSPEENVEKYFS